jgi:hypothetical protein
MSYLRSIIYEVNIICLLKMIYNLKGAYSGDFPSHQSLQNATGGAEDMHDAGAEGTSL